MDYLKILNWKNRNWKEHVLFIIVVILIIHLFQSVNPTKAEVESFLKVEKLFPSYSLCDRHAIEIDSISELSCTYYLRKHTTLIVGKIINIPSFLFLLSAYTPFGYFNYDPTPKEFGCALNGSCKNDEHSYVFVVTRDEGPLVYNPVNGDFIGSYNKLMQEMGCEVQLYEKPFFPIQSPKFKLQEEVFRCS